MVVAFSQNKYHDFGEERKKERKEKEGRKRERRKEKRKKEGKERKWRKKKEGKD